MISPKMIAPKMTIVKWLFLFLVWSGSMLVIKMIKSFRSVKKIIKW